MKSLYRLIHKKLYKYLKVFLFLFSLKQTKHIVNIKMLSKKIWAYFVIAFTMTCAMAGTALIALCLVLDMWRRSEQENDDGKMVEYLQGITHECARTDNGPMNCYSWQHSISIRKLFRKFF